jgi:hypothetical protein
LTLAKPGLYLAPAAPQKTFSETPLRRRYFFGGTVMAFVSRLLAATLMVCACAPRAYEERERTGQTRATGDVVTSLEVKVVPDSVQLILHATNPTPGPLTLDFNTAQRYDFAILDTGGREVWRWSAERMFAQATGSERLEPGATVEYRGVWATPKPGRYVARGSVVATGRQLEGQIEFEVGAESAR